VRNVWTVASREARAYFTSPLAYVVLGIFALLSGYVFYASLIRFSNLCVMYGREPYYASLLNVNDLVVRPLFGTMAIIFLLVVPLITMRLLAEERRQGTAELLFTAPITSGQVVAGKFLGAAMLLASMLAVTLIYPFLILKSDAPPDIKPALVGYLGAFLLGLTFVAIGLFMSSLTENQIIAAFAAFGVLLMLWVLDWVADMATITLAGLLNLASLGLWEKAGLGTGGPTLGELLQGISLMGHSEDFRKGVFDTQHLVFYLSVVFMALFATQRVLESRRWR